MGFFLWLHPATAIRTAVMTSVGLVIFDAIAGMYASYIKSKTKKEQTSWVEPDGIFRVAFKIFVYSFLPAATLWTFISLRLPDFAIFASSVVVSGAILTEFSSINKNLNRVGIRLIPPQLIAIIKGKLKSDLDKIQ